MLPDRLRRVRKAKGLTQQELANKIHTKKSTISNYENNYSSPNHETLSLLADILEVSVDYLLGRTHNPSPLDMKNRCTVHHYADPETHSFIKEYLGASKEKQKELQRFWKFLKEEDTID